MKTVRVLGQPSWPIRSSTVEAWLTRRGGHLAPVTFRLGGKTVQPYLVPPWAGKKIPASTPRILEVLRGDFFCLPFGRDPARPGSPLHGETSNADWGAPIVVRAAGRETLCTELALTAPRGGRVRKELTLRDGHPVVYSRHVISGLTGAATFAHHPCLRFRPADGEAVITTSGFRFGQVLPDGRAGDRTLARPGAIFRQLERMPLRGGGFADFSRYPARWGHDEQIQLATAPAKPFAWTAVTWPEAGHAWFVLKDPRVLPGTLFWFSNGGVDVAPLDGELTAVLGIEDLCSHFGSGPAASAAPNTFNRRGCRTAAILRPGEEADVRTIMGVVALPRGFTRVARILAGRGRITFFSPEGRRASIPLDHGFLTAAPGDLPAAADRPHVFTSRPKASRVVRKPKVSSLSASSIVKHASPASPVSVRPA